MKCLACDYTCKTCHTVVTNCTSCDDSRTFTNNTCPCNVAGFDDGVAACKFCPYGFFHSGNKVCSPCSYTCVVCYLRSTDCYFCNVTRTRNGLTCPCDAGKFDNGVAICADCDPTCLTCNDSAGTV